MLRICNFDLYTTFSIMKLITLWSIIIKIIGVIFAFSFIQSAIIMLQFILNAIGMGGMQSVLTTLLSVLIQGLIAYMCLFRTTEIIRIFKLESTIDEKDLNVNLNTSNVLVLAIAIIGIYSLSQSIPELFGILLNKGGTFGMLFMIVLKVCIGLLMILKAKEIEQRINKYRTK